MDEYRKMEGTNQSSLKKILAHPQLYLNAKEKAESSEESEAEHFVFGRAVDIMLTGTKEEFDETFVRIPDETKCSDAVRVIINEVFFKASLIAERDEDVIQELVEYSDSILRHARANKYRDNYKDDTLVATVIKEGNAYFELLKTTIGKTAITETEYAKAVNCMMALKADQFTQKYSRKTMGVNFWDKFIITFEKKGKKIKGELDRVVIDHNNETITPVDFKTTGQPIYKFISDFWKYRYDIQAAVYREGLLNHPEINELIDKGYYLNNFKYIVVEKDLVNNPMVFNVTPEVIFMGMNGGERSPWKLEGFNNALDRLIFAEQNTAWDYPMEYYEKGEIDIRI